MVNYGAVHMSANGWRVSLAVIGVMAGPLLLGALALPDTALSIALRGGGRRAVEGDHRICAKGGSGAGALRR